MGPTKRDQIINEFGALLFDPAEFRGEEYVYPRVQLAKGHTLGQAFANRYPVRQGKYEAEAIDLVRPDGTKATVLVKGSIKRIDITGPTIHPAISWTRDNEGTRKFNLERTKIQNDDESVTYIDSVVGVLCLAYLQPEIREDWPKRQGYRGAPYEQRMGVAQVPVLVLQPDMKTQLLSSELVEIAEAVS